MFAVPLAAAVLLYFALAPARSTARDDSARFATPEEQRAAASAAFGANTLAGGDQTSLDRIESPAPDRSRSARESLKRRLREARSRGHKAVGKVAELAEKAGPSL